LQEARRANPDTDLTLADLYYKVYVRRAVDVPAIRAELQKIVGSEAPVLFLRADICRHDLLLEIEASGGHPLDVSMGAAST
jgi:hypothetical protein